MGLVDTYLGWKMNDQPLRIGVLGLTHDHVWGVLDDFENTAHGVLVAAADPHAELRQKFAAATGRPAYDDPEKLMQAESLDAILVYSDNRTSVELALAAARRGLHVLIEKPLAADAQGARGLVAACREQNVRLMVNWPFAWWPQLEHALNLATQGAIGPIWQVKYRAAHAGPREMGCSEFFSRWLYDPHLNGGGAYIDYCCYGALLAVVLLGKPERVSAAVGRLARDDMQAEDNGVLIMAYPRAVAIAEGSWTQIGKLWTYATMIHGTRGTLLAEPRVGGRLLLATADSPDGDPLDAPPLAPQHAGPIAHFVHCVRTGQPFKPLCRAEPALEVQGILAEGYSA